MEDIKKELDSLNQKTNFILSAVTGAKENLTNDDVKKLEFENEVLNDMVEEEELNLEEETLKLDRERDLMLVHTLTYKIINNVNLATGYYDDAEESDFEDIALNSVIDEEDLAFLYEHKEQVLEELADFKTEDFYDDVVKRVEELCDGNE